MMSATKQMRIFQQPVRRHRPTALIAALAIAGLLCSAASPQGVPTVLMVPFQTASGPELDYIATNMTTLLPARIAKQARIHVIDAASIEKPLSTSTLASDERLHEAARELKADFILDGTVSSHESAVDINVRLIEVSPPGTISRLFMRAAMLNNLIPEADTLAASLRDIILGSSPTSAAQGTFHFESAPAPRTAPMLPPVPVARPGRIQEESLSASDIPAPETAIGPAHAPPLFEPAPFITQSFRSITLQAITSADIDADNRRELVVSTSSTITIYSLSGTAFTQKQSVTTAPHEQIIDVSAGDVNGNGMEELYVTCQSSRATTSFVLEMSDFGLSRLTPAMPWFFRVYDDPSGELVLLGQKASGIFPAPGEIYRLHWQEGALRKGHNITPPEGLNIFAFTGADFAGDGRPACLGFAPAGSARRHQLTLYCPAGRMLWRDPHAPGFSPRSFGYSGASGRTESIPLRIIRCDLDLDGIPEILVAKNSGEPGGYHTGRLMCMHWDGADMSAAWTSPEFDARISDYTLADLDHDGRPELYVLTVASAGLFGRATSTIAGFRPGR